MRLWPRRYTKDKGTTFGAILLRMGVVTKGDVEHALKLLANCREKGPCDTCELVEACDQTRSKKLGDILMAAGKIDQADVIAALRLQGMMRNGRAADAMLEIVERNTTKAHRRITNTHLRVVDAKG